MRGDAEERLGEAWGKLENPEGNLERRNGSCIIDKLYTRLDGLALRVWPQCVRSENGNRSSDGKAERQLSIVVCRWRSLHFVAATKTEQADERLL